MTNTKLTTYQDPGPPAIPQHHSRFPFQQVQAHPLQQYNPTYAPSPPTSLRLRRRPSITGWYTSSDSSSSALLPARTAYENALQYITTELSPADQSAILHSPNPLHNPGITVRDVQIAVLEAQKGYEVKASKNKVQKWLRRLSARVMFYGGILDVLIQQHPEYVSLAWGAMRFIFVAVLNHEETLVQTAKTLTKIADVLPRSELASILYPTEAMATAVSSLYAAIVQFFMRALKTYKRGRFSRAMSSVISPWDIASKDIVEEIEECSRRVDGLAGAASRAEIRDLHILIQDLSFNFQAHTTQIHLTLTQQAYQFSSFQLSQVTETLSIQYDPEASFTYCQSLLTRRRTRSGLGETQNRRIQARLEGWAEGNSSSLLVLHGVTRAVADAKDLAFDVVGLIRESKVPVIWALPAELDMEEELTTVAVLKTLVLQTLQIHPGILANKAPVLSPAHFRRATTESQWLDLLCTVLSGIPRIFIVVDAEKLFQNFHEDTSWPEEFIRLFRRLIEKNGRHVKVLVVGYNMSLEVRDELEKEGCAVVSLKRARLPKKLRRRALRQGKVDRKVGHGLRSEVFKGKERGEEESSSEG